MANRGTPREKEDLRQRRSKRHLSEALLALMEERPFREISVVDICERAMVHRTTFYAHFEDKTALLRYVVGQLQQSMAAVHERTAKEKGLREGLLEEFRVGLEFLTKHRKVYLSGMEGRTAGVQAVEDAAAQALKDRIEEDGLWGDRPCDPAVAGRFYAGAIMSVVAWWLENDAPIPEEELVEQVVSLLPAAEE